MCVIFVFLSIVFFLNQDLHLALEIFIEAAFDIVHKAVHLLLSPSEAFGKFFRLFSSYQRGVEDDNNTAENATISTAALGDNDPTPTERNTGFRQPLNTDASLNTDPPLNTDARTCQDVITELG